MTSNGTLIILYILKFDNFELFLFKSDLRIIPQ